MTDWRSWLEGVGHVEDARQEGDPLARQAVRVP